MPPSPIAAHRRRTTDRRIPAEEARRSTLLFVATTLLAAAIGVVATVLVEPARRLGWTSGSVLGTIADAGVFVALFGSVAAVLPAVFDLTGAWVRATPESERRRGADGDGGGSVFDAIGFGDCDGGGDCGGTD